MKIQKQHIPAAVAVGLILCMMAYFALNLPFFTFEDPLARASLSTDVSADGELRFAYDGDRIVLAPGRYGHVVLSGRSFAPSLTLASADPADPAVLETLKLDKVGGMTLSG